MIRSEFQFLRRCPSSPLPLKWSSHVICFNPWHWVGATLFWVVTEKRWEDDVWKDYLRKGRTPKQELNWANVLSALVKTEAYSSLGMTFCSSWLCLLTVPFPPVGQAFYLPMKDSLCLRLHSLFPDASWMERVSTGKASLRSLLPPILSAAEVLLIEFS